MPFTDALLAVGFGDPGWLDPLTLHDPNPFTEQWYGHFPDVYREADARDVSTSLGYPLWGYLDAMASVLVEPLRLAELIARGALTDPALAPDEWIPWMAQAAGVTGVGVAALRTRLATLITAPPLGSRHYLETLIQTYLTGTKNVEVTPVPPWGIKVRLRAEEATAAGGVDALIQTLYASGQVPTGFLLQGTVDQETWAEVQTSLPTWAPGQGQTWARIESMGLTGAGITTGGVRWVGTATGVHP